MQRQPHPRDAELVADDAANLLGESFDELVFAALDEIDQPLGDALVAERIVDLVARRGFRDVGRHLDIEADGLADLAFPVVDADDGFDLQLVNENDIHRAVFRFVGAGGNLSRWAAQKKSPNG